MRCNSIVILAGVIAASVGSALADTVYLTNGNYLEGRVKYEDGRVVVEQPTGKIYLDSSKVDHIDKSKTVLDEFDEKVAAVQALGNDATAGAWAQAGRFASEHAMRDRAEKCYFKALAIDSENTTARLALGFEKFQDRWMSSDEANQARGLVKYNGAWVTPEAKADLLRIEAIAQAERARADAEGAKAEQERLKLERLDTELQLIEAERERLRYANDASGGTVYVSRPPSPPPPAAPPPAPSHPASAPSAPSSMGRPPTTSFSPLVVDTPDATVRLGTGGNIVVQPKR